MNIYVTYGMRKERSTLRESLETSVEISFSDFKKIVSSYHYYAFDERCNQVLFLSNDMQKEEFDWLFIQIKYIPFMPLY